MKKRTERVESLSTQCSEFYDQYQLDAEQEAKLQKKLDDQQAQRNKLIDAKKKQNFSQACMWLPPFAALFVANSRFGKSTTVLKILSEPQYEMEKHFAGKHMYVISPTQMFDPVQQEIRKVLMEKYKMPEENFIHEPGQADQLIKKIDGKQTERLEKKKPLNQYLLLFDDCVSQMDCGNSGVLTRLGVQGRHLKISVFFLSQIARQISTSFRRNATHYLLGQINTATELECAASEICLPLSKKEFITMYNDVQMNHDYGSILICQQNHPRERFIINLTEVVELFK